jgi:hypothetical protein
LVVTSTSAIWYRSSFAIARRHLDLKIAVGGDDDLEGLDELKSLHASAHQYLANGSPRWSFCNSQGRSLRQGLCCRRCSPWAVQ